ncbi:secreted RxLR effector protein 161-like [Rosa chinensis]|uniref:secreted RxLR effector protein 161-like n=1 Tax=Rosa chinensis TaxID=74649 RepID=UPI000D08F53D|nr:secreted RxLR effector protein 161-like [Rosa chinensis]
MGTSSKLDADLTVTSVDQTLYRSMIGSSFSVGVCARYQADLKESHLKTVKRIIRYVSGTSNYVVVYIFDSNVEIAGYTDSYWAGNVDDRRSTSGGCFFVGNNLVLWHSKKQNCVSLSTAEAEYIAADFVHLNDLFPVLVDSIFPLSFLDKKGEKYLGAFVAIPYC